MLTTTRQDEENLLYAQRQLVALATEIYKREYNYKMANGDILPVQMFPEAAFKKFIEFKEYDMVGMAAVITDYYKGGPQISVLARRFIVPIRTVGDHISWTWEEINIARAENEPLESLLLDGSREGCEAYLNKLGWYGDSEYGLSGIQNSAIPRFVSISSYANASSPDVLLSLLNSPVTAMVSATNQMEKPKTLVLPSKQYEQIGTTMRSSYSDMSVLEAFLELQGKMGQVSKVLVDDNLKGFGENGEDCALLLPDDEKKVCLAIARDYEIIPVQQSHLAFIVHGLMRPIGVVVLKPLSAMIISGI